MRGAVSPRFVRGAAASLGLSLTDRAHAQRLQFVTGHGRDGQLPESTRWYAVADPTVTIVVYMPRRAARDLCRDGHAGKSEHLC